MAMIGLPKSPSFMPVARQRPRAPAMLRPWVEVRERYGGMGIAPMEWGSGRNSANLTVTFAFFLSPQQGRPYGARKGTESQGEAANELTSPSRIARNGALNRPPCSLTRGAAPGAGVAQW
jgi:hypothetical protein